MGVSKQAAWQLYNTELEAPDGARRDRGRLIAREALALAAEELRQIRAGVDGSNLAHGTGNGTNGHRANGDR